MNSLSISQHALDRMEECGITEEDIDILMSITSPIINKMNRYNFKIRTVDDKFNLVKEIRNRRNGSFDSKTNILISSLRVVLSYNCKRIITVYTEDLKRPFIRNIH